MKCPACGRELTSMKCYYPACCGPCDDVQAGRKTLEQAEAARGTYVAKPKETS